MVVLWKFICNRSSIDFKRAYVIDAEFLYKHVCYVLNPYSFLMNELCSVYFRQLKNPNLQLFLKDHLSQSHVLSYLHQRLSSEDRMHTDTKRHSPISANPGDILILTATTEVPQLHLNQPVDVPIIVGWHQHDSRHSFSCCVGKAMLDLKNYSDMLFFPEHLSVTEHLETVQVCSI